MKDKIKRIIIGISTIILIIVMFTYVDINEIFKNFQRISVYGIFGFILIYTIAFLLRTIRLKQIIQGLALDASYSTLLGSYGIGWSVNELTPGKIGDLVRIEIIHEKEDKIGLSKSICAIAIERVIDLLILFGIVCFSLFFMYLNNIQGITDLNLEFYIILTAFIIFGGIILLIILIFKPNWILKGFEKISSKLRNLFERFLKNFLEGIKDFRKDKKKITNVVLVSIPVWFFETLTLVLIFFLTGYSEVNIMIIILAQLVVFFTKTFPITPGGWIVSENAGALLIFLFYPTIPVSSILSLFILDHFLRIGYIFIYGIGSALWLNFHYKSINLKKLKGKNNNNL
jgi:uncharacterized protein (TIRG00374 family)